MSHLGYLRGRRRPAPGWHPLTARLSHALRSTSLTDLALRGARPATPVRLVIGRDVSGSMERYRGAREAALTELIAWAPANLRPTDEIGVLDFAEAAGWSMRPTSVHHLATFGATRREPELDGNNTLLAPVIDRVAGLGSHSGRVSLWLVSDGLYPDYPPSGDSARRLLQSAGIGSMPLLIPDRSAEPPPIWEDTFPDEPCLSFDGDDARTTALVFGQALALVTGQRLVRVPGTD